MSQTIVVQNARPSGTQQKYNITAAAVVGAVIFLGSQAVWRTPEVGWLTGGLGHVRGRARRAMAEATHG